MLGLSINSNRSCFNHRRGLQPLPGLLAVNLHYKIIHEKSFTDGDIHFGNNCKTKFFVKLNGFVLAVHIQLQVFGSLGGNIIKYKLKQ